MKLKNTLPQPPKWAERLLEWLAAPHVIEQLQGDLQELFEKRSQQYGVQKAKLLYILDLLNLIHPRLWKNNHKPYSSLNPIDMLQHNLLLTLRTFYRSKGSFLINLIGLSTGLACALLIFLWVNDELSVDRFHQNDSRLFQVMLNVVNADGIQTGGATPGLLAHALGEEMPEIEYATVVGLPKFTMGAKGIISVQDNYIKANEWYVSSDFFHVFSFNLIEGNEGGVLKDKHDVVLSEELAMKLFQTTKNIIGKTIKWDRGTGNSGKVSGVYRVSGVFEKIPANSSAQFDLLFTYQLYFEKYTSNLEDWKNTGPSTYVVLKQGTDMAQFNGKIKNFIRAKLTLMNDTSKVVNDSRDMEGIGLLSLEKYSDNYLYGRYENGIQAGGRIEYVKLFSLIAIFILAIACINFINLSTAKASRRFKEIGIKKTIGADRKALIFQFLGESMYMTFLSLLTAILIVVLLLPEFNHLTGKELSLSLNTGLFLNILAIAIITGFVAGSYPALYLSRFKPNVILKGSLNPSTGESWARQGLVVFQFALSVILIVSVFVVYKQIDFIQSKNLGYNKDNIIRFSKEGKVAESLDIFLSEIKNIPGVVNASIMGYDISVPSGTTPLDWEGKNPAMEIEFGSLEVGYDLIEVLGYKLTEGRSFSREFSLDDKKIIFNEAAISAMGLKDPVGKTVKLWGEDRQIIGVVQNFHFESLYEKVKPCFFRIEPSGNNIVAKIKPGMERETIGRIEKFYKKYTNGLAFEYTFLDDDYQAVYAAEQRVAILSRYFAGVAILISCLGLLGLSAFTAQRRRKEIGIRKVLGSSELAIVGLLSGEFMQTVLIAILIALPISYLIAINWLHEFAYAIDLKWWFFAGSGLIALFIAGLTVATQTLQAAKMNPMQTLREE